MVSCCDWFVWLGRLLVADYLNLVCCVFVFGLTVGVAFCLWFGLLASLVCIRIYYLTLVMLFMSGGKLLTVIRLVVIVSLCFGAFCGVFCLLVSFVVCVDFRLVFCLCCWLGNRPCLGESLLVCCVFRLLI